MQENNFFFNSDPLLGNSTGYDTQYKEIERMQQALEQKKQMMKQAKEQMSKSSTANQSQSPVWDEIENIISGMTDKEFEIVTNNEEFIESQNTVMSILQARYMRMMRPLVEGTPEGKDALEKHLTLVKRLRKVAASEVDKEINDFKEYKEKYSDLPYSEYQKMKRKGAKK